MTKPKAVLFDYGFTLCTEKDNGSQAGWAAVLEHARYNPAHVTPERITAEAEALQQELGLFNPDWEKPMELWFPSFLRILLESLDILLDISGIEAEQIYWDAANPAASAPHIGEALDALEARGVPTGVVSNMWFTRITLERRVRTCLPQHQFQFILASSEYAFRKPNKRIFDLALHKIGADASETWFCGDNPVCDIEGAHRAGMRPFWYRVNGDFNDTVQPDCPCTRISDWREFLWYLD